MRHASKYHWDVSNWHVHQYACTYLENAEDKQTNKHAKTSNIGISLTIVDTCEQKNKIVFFLAATVMRTATKLIDPNQQQKNNKFAPATHLYIFFVVVLHDQHLKVPSYPLFLNGGIVVSAHQKFCCLCSCSLFNFFFFFTAAHCHLTGR